MRRRLSLLPAAALCALLLPSCVTLTAGVRGNMGTRSEWFAGLNIPVRLPGVSAPADAGLFPDPVPSPAK